MAKILGTISEVVLAAYGAASIAAALPQGSASAGILPAKSETVVVTYRVRPGKEDDVARAIAEHWATVRRLGLVLPWPHLTLRGADENGAPIFLDVLAWKDHDAPDSAPAEVRAIWDRLEALCEKRGGRRGIEFPEFAVLDGAGRPASR